MSHTPGPLSITRKDARTQFTIESDHSKREGEWDDIYVSISGFFGSYGPHMFCAAPTLLEALKEARDELWRAHQHTMSEHEFHSRYKAIDAAISKATGGSK